MVSTDARRRKPAPLRRGFGALLVALLVLAPAGVVLLAVETRPLVDAVGPPDAASAARTRDLAERLRTLVATNGAAGPLTISEDEMNAAIASGGRVLAGVTGRARVAEGGLVLEMSAGGPHLPAGLWANLSLGLAASDAGLRVTAARLGRLPLPPALVLPALRVGLDRVLGDGLGTAALAAVGRLDVAPPEVTVGFTEVGRAAFFDRLRDRVRAGNGEAERIYVHLWWLDKAGDGGELPGSGSLLPYLRYAVERSQALAGDSERDELKAALLALALYCGDERLAPAVGADLADHMRGPGNHCEGITLGGRDDLKRHFVVSAAIHAASTDQAVLGVGELKELLDSNAGGSGFSFDDMAANLAGARFAAVFLDAPRAAWPGMLARVGDEADVLPSLDGLPRGLSDAEFRARYGDVDSPAFAALMAEIGQRLDALPAYGGPPPT